MDLGVVRNVSTRVVHRDCSNDDREVWLVHSQHLRNLLKVVVDHMKHACQDVVAISLVVNVVGHDVVGYAEDAHLVGHRNLKL